MRFPGAKGSKVPAQTIRHIHHAMEPAHGLAAFTGEPGSNYWVQREVNRVKRREFIAGLGITAVAAPLTARAQQSARRLVVLLPGRDGDEAYLTRLKGLREALARLGWTEGRNISIEVRWAGAAPGHINEIAAELVARTPDVVVTSGSVATAAMKRATASIPVVFVLVNEPVAQGFVASLARPGGNLTGFTNIEFTVVGKMVELLKAMVPALNRVGLMFNSDAYPIFDGYLHTLQADPRRPVEVVRAAVRMPSEIDGVIDALAALPGSGLAVLPDGGFNVTNRATIQAALDRHRMPSIAPHRQYVLEGALMSYGSDELDVYRRAADYIDRILKGAKPTDLPVQQPVKFKFVLNLKAARALGIEPPDRLLAIADDVIE
jgi:putative ABC transport system substrate-binding protein